MNSALSLQILVTQSLIIIIFCRLNLLKQSGEEDWKKRVHRSSESGTPPSPSPSPSPMEVKLREKIGPAISVQHVEQYTQTCFNEHPYLAITCLM
jgi:hypothetical protein